ncbi:MAG: class Ib ribonucleoside-diphosphate reductase assembly flavoprotein NrdI [Eubacteriales bacterium]|nr:class Ib ribonucleoside-diphosphate reductase assembly flavoprotein NrdI [Eubacteriales bacterium]
MFVVYDSLTGLCKKFAEALGYDTIAIDAVDDSDLTSEYFLVTRCFNFGEVPEPTREFLKKHHRQVFGQAVSGNRNWGQNYAIVGDKIEKALGIPCVCKFEAMGFPHERQLVRDFIAAHLEKQAK